MLRGDKYLVHNKQWGKVDQEDVGQHFDLSYIKDCVGSHKLW